MIGVQVGEQHGIHLLWGVTGGFKVVLHHAQGWPEALCGPGVDQHQVAACIDQVSVDGGLHALAGVNERARQQTLDILGAGAGEDLAVEVDITVIQRGHLKIAQGHAIETCDLLLLLGHRCCVGHQGQGATQNQGLCCK